MMTDLPFAETSDIDLDILFHSLHNVDLTSSSDERYEKRFSDILNSKFDEMLLQFDPIVQRLSKKIVHFLRKAWNF